MTRQRGMKVLTVLISLAMGLTAFHAIENWPIGSSFADEVSEVKSSCAYVGHLAGWGSGFVVGPNEVMTAGHIALRKGLWVRTADGRKHKVIGKRYSLDAKPDPNMLLLGMESPKTAYDVAILTVDPNGPLPEPVQFSFVPVRQGEEVYTIGTPGDTSLELSVLTGRVTKNDLSCEYGPFWKGEGLVICDYFSQCGTSGGPVFRNGKVVGVHVASICGYGIFVPIIYVSDLL